MRPFYHFTILILCFIASYSCSNDQGIMPETSIPNVTDKDTVFNQIIFSKDFECRTSIDIYQVKNKYIPDFNISKFILPSKKTVYISIDGNDENSGLQPTSAIKTLQCAISKQASTIIFLPGKYNVDVNFTPGQKLKNINIIGIDSVIIDSKEKTPLNIIGNAYIENVHFRNGTKGALWCYIENNDEIVACNMCSFNYSTGKESLGGFKAQGGNYYIVNCEASYNEADGFNYHKTDGLTSYIPHFTEINCKGFFNGAYPIESSYYSNNGSTTHDGSKGIRLNCEYGACRGGIIADVNPETMTYNIGCRAFSSTITETNLDFCANIYCGTEAIMYLIDCISSGSIYDISVSGKGIVFTTDLYTNNYNDSGRITLFSTK